MDVVLVRWPAERHRRDRLAAEEVPRLLLVEDGAPPPPVGDCLEDWIRVPVDDLDLQARMVGLAARGHRHLTVSPALDDDGVLRLGQAWVSLPPVEARLTSALLERMGAVVSRDALARAGWPDGAPGRNALDVHVLRLRRRLSAVGLAIRTVRSRGYLLEVSDARQERVQEA
jgi:DNA-binding response OmpR family regulator